MGRTATGGDELTIKEEILIGHTQAGTYSGTVPAGTVNGANTVFTLSASPSPASSLLLFKNGVRQKAGGEDFTLVGNTITFVSAPLTGDVLLANFLVDTDT